MSVESSAPNTKLRHIGTSQFIPKGLANCQVFAHIISGTTISRGGDRRFRKANGMPPEVAELNEK